MQRKDNAGKIILFLVMSMAFSAGSDSVEAAQTISATTINGTTVNATTVSATTLQGAYSGTINSANISAGTFGSNTGGGNFTFPAYSIVQNGNAYQLGGYNNNGYFAMNNGSTYWGLIGNYAVNDWRIGYGTTINMTGGWNLRWDASGNVVVNNGLGVGIAGNPAYKLDVAGDINFTGILRQNGSPYVGSQWTTSGNNIYYNTGAVGIGTNSPSGQFHVKNPTGDVTQYLEGGTGGGTYLYMRQVGFDRAFLGWSAADSTLYLNNVAGAALRFGTNNTEQMRITSGGNVGIGMTGPSFKLDITDSQGTDIPVVRIQNNNSATYSQGYWALSPNMVAGSGHYTGYVVGREFSARNAGMMGFFYAGLGSTSNYLYFGGHSVNDAMVVTMGGNVGIGTTGPGYKLDVAGDIYANGWIRTSGSHGWYNQDYGGGWWMQDSTWIRSYGSKDVYINTVLRADGGIISGATGGNGAGTITATGNVYAPAYYWASNTNYGFVGTQVFADTINTGVSGDPLEINYSRSGDMRMYNGDITMQYGHYLYPGSNSGIGDFQKSYYLSSNGSYGLYTNTSMYFAGGVYMPERVQATIFYDWDNTGYYVDPSAGTYINYLQVAGGSLLANWPGYNGITQTTGNYMWPGFNDYGGWNQSYYLAGNHSYGLYSNTSMYSAGFYAPGFYYVSDISLKKDVQTLTGSLDNIMKLRGVSFNWKEDGKPSIGLIAQEVEKVYPQVVSTKGDKNLKSVEYGNLVAPLIEAVKEQEAKIEAQGRTIEQLQKEIELLKNKTKGR